MISSKSIITSLQLHYHSRRLTRSGPEPCSSFKINITGCALIPPISLAKEFTRYLDFIYQKQVFLVFSLVFFQKVNSQFLVCLCNKPFYGRGYRLKERPQRNERKDVANSTGDYHIDEYHTHEYPRGHNSTDDYPIAQSKRSLKRVRIYSSLVAVRNHFRVKMPTHEICGTCHHTIRRRGCKCSDSGSSGDGRAPRVSPRYN